jgi:branched-chain amino acid transport system substrate-binding protein
LTWRSKFNIRLKFSKEQKVKEMIKKGRLLTVAIGLFLIAAATISYWYFSRPILIGAILPIDTSLGNEENLFIRYYQDKRPKIGLHPVKFIIENPAPTEAEVSGAYQRLNAQGVSVIIGGVLSQDGAWAADNAAKTGIPTFGITSSSALLSGKKDGFFRLTPTNATQAAAVGQYYQQKGIKRLVLVTSEDNVVYVEPFVKGIKENFSGEIVQIPFTTIEEVSQKISDAHPDGVFAILAAKDVIQVITIVREQSPDIMIGSSSWGSIEILSLYSGPLLDGVQFFSLGLEISGEDYKSEIADFESTYNMKATNGSQYSVSILHMLYDAIGKVGASRAALKAYFETPRTYDTSYGKMAIDEYGDGATNRIVLLQTINGVMKTMEVLELK